LTSSFRRIRDVSPLSTALDDSRQFGRMVLDVADI
jgi:hypothetical protein